jgi:hypothetical protein
MTETHTPEKRVRARDGGPPASEAYLVEALDRAAGVAIRENGGFRFFAAAAPFFRLDRRWFRRLAMLRAAVNSLVVGERRPRGPFPRVVD